MDYSQLQSGQYFECKIKATYVEIYVYNPTEKKYDFVFSLQKKDFDGVLGYGEIASSISEKLVPITLSDSAIITILQKAINSSIGIVNVDTDLKNEIDSFVRVDENFIVSPNYYTDSYKNDTFIDDSTNVPLENEVEYDNVLLSRIDDGVVYVNPKAIDCTVISDEEVEVEVEEIVEETKKDYSKLIWIALAAAAALL